MRLMRHGSSCDRRNMRRFRVGRMTLPRTAAEAGRSARHVSSEVTLCSWEKGGDGLGAWPLSCDLDTIIAIFGVEILCCERAIFGGVTDRGCFMKAGSLSWRSWHSFYCLCLFASGMNASHPCLPHPQESSEPRPAARTSISFHPISSAFPLRFPFQLLVAGSSPAANTSDAQTCDNICDACGRLDFSKALHCLESEMLQENVDGILIDNDVTPFFLQRPKGVVHSAICYPRLSLKKAGKRAAI